MKAKGQLQRLLRIQELALALGDANKIVEQAPQRIEQIESHFRERNAEYVAVKDRYDELDADQRTRSSELAVLEERLKKYKDDLMEVKNQREYAAMLKEIDAVKAQISEHEEAILKDMEEIEKLKEDLKEHEDHIKTERVAVEKERGEVEAQADDARKTIEALGAPRRDVESELPRSVLVTVRRLEETRQGIFLSQVENGSCLSCYVRVRPQVFQEIRQAAKVHTCSNCRRFLYYAASLKPEPEASPSTDGVGADAV